MGPGSGQKAGSRQVAFQSSTSGDRDSAQAAAEIFLTTHHPTADRPPPSVGAEMGRKPGPLTHHPSEGWGDGEPYSTELRGRESWSQSWQEDWTPGIGPASARAGSEQTPDTGPQRGPLGREPGGGAPGGQQRARGRRAGLERAFARAAARRRR